MSVSTPEDYPEPEEFLSPEMVQIMKGLDQITDARENIVLSSLRFRDLPTDKNLEKINNDGSYWMKTILVFAVELIEKENVDAPTIIANRFIEEDMFRVDFLNDITGTANFEPCELSFDLLIAHFSPDEPEEILDLEEVEVFFLNSARNDFDIFVDTIKDGRKRKYMEKAMQSGKVALDIGKIAAGVWLGTQLAKLGLNP